MTKKYTYHEDNEPLGNGQVFVFGSNYAGRHGAGAALFASKVLGFMRVLMVKLMPYLLKIFI